MFATFLDFSLNKCDRLAEIHQGTERRPRPIIWYLFQPLIPTSNHLRQPFSFFFFLRSNKNMKIELFGHPLNPGALGTPPWVQERQILFRIALTRALYDQTAPQLSSFYVPEKLSFSCLVFLWILTPLSFE